VEKYSDNYFDYFFTTKLPFPFFPREWLIRIWESKDDKTAISMNYSINRIDHPLEKKKVRAILQCKGILFAIHSNSLGGCPTRRK
jgi:hypothetical protein